MQNNFINGRAQLILLCFASFLFSIHAHAQTITDALKLTESEQYEAATDVYKKLIAADPNKADYYYYLGENYLLADNSDSALATFKAGQQIDKNNPLLMIGIAKYDLDKYNVAEMKRVSEMEAEDTKKLKDLDPNKPGEMAQKIKDAVQKTTEAAARYAEASTLVGVAKGMIEVATSTNPKNVPVLIEAADALIHYKNKDTEKAKQYLDKAAALEPKNPEIKILYGDLYAELNNGTLSADYYNQALQLNPSSPRSIVNKGRLYKRTTNYTGAAEEFQRAISIDNNFAPAHRELGEVYYRLNKLELAKAEYKKYLELSKNNCGARTRYASFLYITKDYQGALNETAQLKNCDPNSISALRIKAYSSYEMGDSVKALAALQDLVTRIHPDKIIALDYEYYGKALIKNNQDSLGVYYLRKAFQIDNTRCDLLTEIYKSYDKMKKYAEAADAMNQKIGNCKATVTDYFYLGRSYFFAGDYSKADSAFAKVNELTPTYASGWLWRAKTNEFIDSLPQKKGLAKPYYEKYIEVASSDTSANSASKYKEGLISAYRYQAIYAFNIEKNIPKTKELYRKILELDPEDQNAKDAIRGFEYEKEQKTKKKP